MLLCFSFFANDNKSVPRGENHLKSNHVESFSASQGVFEGQVHASMKKKTYNVTLLLLLLLLLLPVLLLRKELANHLKSNHVEALVQVKVFLRDRFTLV